MTKDQEIEVLKEKLAQAAGLLARLYYSKNYAALEKVIPEVDAFLALWYYTVYLRRAQAEQQEYCERCGRSGEISEGCGPSGCSCRLQKEAQDQSE